MNNRWISGILFIILGLLIAFGPITIFPVCEVHNEKQETMDVMKEEMTMTKEVSATGEGQENESMSLSMSSPMKCYWTARAELGIGLVIAVIGILLLLHSSVAIRLGLTIGAGLNAILALLIPTVLIGVCQSTRMACHSLTLGALIILSSFAIIISTLNIILLYQVHKKGKRNHESKTINDYSAGNT
jgi:Domain of unknown function (DUF4418)